MNQITSFIFGFLGALILMIPSLLKAQESSPDQQRAQWIVDAFNSRPHMLVEPLTLAHVKVRNGLGRVDVNPKAKFSYFIQTERSQDLTSPIHLIPMATSRFAPNYYQTDDWWDAHKNQKPMPRQPEQEVIDYLRAMKLTTNPDVLRIDPLEGRVNALPLQEFLLNVYIENHTQNGIVTVYRGAEKENETIFWENQQRPPGVRYWTPTANYAWRYARKNLNFVSDLVDGKAPLLKFEIPVEDFRRMTKARWPQLTLGTELTKKVHDGFDATRRFQDQLTRGFDYLGEGSFGVEFEIRSTRSGADMMGRYYRGTISIEELAQDRIRTIRRATERFQKQRPGEASHLEAVADSRVRVIQTEARLLKLLQKKGSPEEIDSLLRTLGSDGELTRVDGFEMGRFVRERLAKGGFSSEIRSATLLQPALSSMKSCRKVH